MVEVDMQKRLTSAAKIAVGQRNYRRARDRALTRLAKAHPDEYRTYLQEEKARDEELSKKWLDITGNTSSPITLESYKDAIEGAVDPSDSGENQSYYGGEE